MQYKVNLQSYTHIKCLRYNQNMQCVRVSTEKYWFCCEKLRYWNKIMHMYSSVCWLLITLNRWSSFTSTMEISKFINMQIWKVDITSSILKHRKWCSMQASHRLIWSWFHQLMRRKKPEEMLLCWCICRLWLLISSFWSEKRWSHAIVI